MLEYVNTSILLEFPSWMSHTSLSERPCRVVAQHTFCRDCDLYLVVCEIEEQWFKRKVNCIDESTTVQHDGIKEILGNLLDPQKPYLVEIMETA